MSPRRIGRSDFEIASDRTVRGFERVRMWTWIRVASRLPLDCGALPSPEKELE